MTTTATPAPPARQRLLRIVREVASFATVGAVGTAVNFLVFNLCAHLWHMYTVRSSVIATLVAIAVNYVGYRYWVYRDRERSSRTREMALFLGFSLVGLVIENGVLYATHYGAHWNTPLEDNVFKFAGMVVATAFRFASYRTWVFRRAAEGAEPAAVTAPRPDPAPAPAPVPPRPDPARKRG